MSDLIIDNNTVLNLNKNILKRYEHNLKDGTMILFDVLTEEIWLGNSSTKEIIDLIDGKNSIQDIYSQILFNYGEKDFENVIEALNLLIEDLFSKNFIEIISS